MGETTLTIHASLPALVAIFAQAELDVREAFRLVRGAEDRLNDAFTLHHYLTIRVDTGGRDSWTNIEKTIQTMRRKGWEAISERLELKRALSIAAAAALEKHLDEATALPAITEESVWIFAERWGGNIEASFNEAVREVYDWLRPRSRGSHGAGRFVTNSLFELGERVVLTGMVKVSRSDTGHFQVVYSMSAHLTALERVFLTLDGQGMRTKSYRSDIENAIASTGTDGRGATDYFEFRACKNGHLHLRFKVSGLLADFNARAGGAILKPSTAL